MRSMILCGNFLKLFFCLLFEILRRLGTATAWLDSELDSESFKTHLISFSSAILNRLHTRQPSHPPRGSYSQSKPNNKLLGPGWLFGSMGQFCCQILLWGLHGFILTCTLVTSCILSRSNSGSFSMSSYCCSGDQMSTSGGKESPNMFLPFPLKNIIL